MFDKLVAKLAIPMVIASFIAVPWGINYYDSVYLPSQEEKGTKVFTLYWSGQKGITRQRINGWNYWQSEFDRLQNGELKVSKGDRVVFRLISSDVYHGFAMPAYGIGVVDTVYIKPGDITRVEFTADKAGTFKFFCTIVCGSKEVHDAMGADLTVMP